jgi:hypothetical protein
MINIFKFRKEEKNMYFRIKRNILVISIISLFFIGVAQAGLPSGPNKSQDAARSTGTQTAFDPFTQGWLYRKQITIDHTKVSGTLVDFPVLISTTDCDLQVKTQTDGDDILFMNATGIAMPLSYEFERFDQSTGTLVAWVKIPYLSSSQDAVLYIYYGNSKSTNQQQPISTWNSDYISIWHFNQETGPAYDSTLRHNGTANNGVTEGSTGLIDRAFLLDGTSGIVDFGNINQEVSSFSLWLKPINPITTETVDTGILQLARTGSITDAVALGNCGDLVTNETICLAQSPPEDRTSILNLTITNTMFHLMTFNWNATATRYDIYYDGVLQPVTYGSGAGHVPLVFFHVFMIGHDYPGSHGLFFNGYIDEARLLGVSRSGGWILTEYNNQNNPSTFLRFGPEELPTMKTTIIFGKIAGLATGDPYVTFNAVKVKCIQFSPFVFIPYNSNEQIIISKDYIGLITPNMVLAICKTPFLP